MPPQDVPPSVKPRHENTGFFELDDDDSERGHRVAATPRHDSLFVRAGQWLTKVWASVSQAFARLHEGIGNAAAAVARFFQRASGTEEAERSTMHVRTPLPTQPGAAASSAAQPSATEYFPIESPPPAPPTVSGILGGIPQKRSSAVDDAARPAPPVIVAGQAAFNEWLALTAQGASALQIPARYLDDPDCMTFARTVMKSTGEYTSRGIPLPGDKDRLRKAAQLLLSAHSERRRRDNIAQQRAAREAERARRREEARTAQPGQRDFEGLVAAYVRHRDNRSPFMIFDNSRFLRQDCLAHGTATANTPYELDALDYAKRWAIDPSAAADRMRTSKDFVTFAHFDALDAAIASEKAAREAALFDTLSTAPPPPLPKPRWHAVLAAMPQWSNSELEAIGHVLGMSREQVRQAMEGLRSLVAGPLEARSQAGNRVGYLLDYGSDVALRASSTRDAIESASLLVSKLGGNLMWAEMSQAKTFFEQLQPMRASVSDALDKELDVLLPTRRQPGSERRAAIPSLEGLSNRESEEGGEMFERYVDAYKKFSNSVTYALPRQSPYFKPGCLAFAKTFLEQVAQMPQGAVVDTHRLAAAAYLLSEAQRQGIT